MLRTGWRKLTAKCLLAVVAEEATSSDGCAWLEWWPALLREEGEYSGVPLIRVADNHAVRGAVK